jgi:hypothetical protein
LFHPKNIAFTWWWIDKPSKNILILKKKGMDINMIFWGKMVQESRLRPEKWPLNTFKDVSKP